MLRQVALEVETRSCVQKTARETGVRLRLTDCRDLDSERMTMLFELEGEPASLDRAVRELRRSKDISQLHETEVSANKKLCMGVVRRPPLCVASMGLGIVCLTCPYSQPGEKIRWEILVRRSGDIRTLVSRLEEKGIGAEISSISRYDHEEVLTPRQKEVISEAVRQGYFDFPRKVGLTELSKRIGIKPSTLSEIMRGAERKIMTSFGAAAVTD
jgi:predicted DNA binding protein